MTSVEMFTFQTWTVLWIVPNRTVQMVWIPKFQMAEVFQKIIRKSVRYMSKSCLISQPFLIQKTEQKKLVTEEQD
jgi:hypothetical protein